MYVCNIRTNHSTLKPRPIQQSSYTSPTINTQYLNLKSTQSNLHQTQEPNCYYRCSSGQCFRANIKLMSCTTVKRDWEWAGASSFDSTRPTWARQVSIVPANGPSSHFRTQCELYQSGDWNYILLEILVQYCMFVVLVSYPVLGIFVLYECYF